MDEPSAVRFAHIEDMLAHNAEQLSELSNDVQEARKAATELTEALSRRVGLLEVGVRALEDRALAQKIIDQERERVAAERAESQITARNVWLAVAAILCGNTATLLGALIAGHVI